MENKIFVVISIVIFVAGVCAELMVRGVHAQSHCCLIAKTAKMS